MAVPICDALDLCFLRDPFDTYRLEDVCEILSGENINKADTTPDGTFPVYSGGVEPMGYTDKANRNGNMVIVSTQGSAGSVSYSWGPFWQSSFNAVLAPNTDMIRPRFLYYCIKRLEPLLISRRLPSMVPSISLDTLRGLQIKVPRDLMEQQRIADALDYFGVIVDSKDDGLLMLERLVHKRFEAVRESLLSFKPMA